MYEFEDVKIALDNAAQKMNSIIATTGILTKNDILRNLNLPEDYRNGDKVVMVRA